MKYMCTPNGWIQYTNFMHLITPDGILIYFPSHLVEFSHVLLQEQEQGRGIDDTNPARVWCTQNALSLIIHDLENIASGYGVNTEVYDMRMLDGIASCAKNLGITVLDDVYRSELQRRTQLEQERQMEEERRLERIRREQEEERQRQLPTRENAFRALGVKPDATPLEILGVIQGVPFTAIRRAYLQLKDAWTKQGTPLASIVLEIIEEAYKTLQRSYR